jgi:HlyD family secretion protein
MPKRRPLVLAAVAALAVVAAIVWWARRDHGSVFYTGFVEGEERVIRSEVTARILEVRYAEGAAVPANEVIAQLDDRDVASAIKSKEQELVVVDTDIATQRVRITLVESTWGRDVSARDADVHQAEAATKLAEQTLKREQELVKSGASTAQLLDDKRSARDQARSQLEHAREMLARTRAEEHEIAVAKHNLENLQAKRELAEAQLAELRVRQTKYSIRAPAVATVVQTQFMWPGELAQPGAAIVSVLDPADKYVQVYVPVGDVDRFRVGQRVEIELDSAPGRRVPGEVSFVADQASFTPEKIQTRNDRLGQVYRAKVRILEGVERFQPGTEGNVYVLSDTTARTLAERK